MVVASPALRCKGFHVEVQRTDLGLGLGSRPCPGPGAPAIASVMRVVRLLGQDTGGRQGGRCAWGHCGCASSCTVRHGCVFLCLGDGGPCAPSRSWRGAEVVRCEGRRGGCAGGPLAGCEGGRPGPAPELWTARVLRWAAPHASFCSAAHTWVGDQDPQTRVVAFPNQV